jgi:type I restriction-modification system DNA methylase subunit/restriction endonuclease S subunit
MITQENLPTLLTLLQFELNDNVYSKYFPAIDCYLRIDFNKKEIIYPEYTNGDKDNPNGMLINERQTCNFASPENFVVLECVYRLLEKGYLPASIELEPKWKLGHGASGGRADILVRDQARNPLLLIECKTAGKEFEKAWKYTLQNGAQLFSYAQQIQATQYLCLYAADFDEKTKLHSHQYKVISHKDNTDILIENSKLKSFKEATDVQERYQVWKDTYKLEHTELGIFEESIEAYSVGKEVYTLQDLKKIESDKDIQAKYHEFATILRQHNISGRENAFDKLVNLFLAKIVDEKHNPQNLKFRWKGIASDDYFKFIDRLEELYANGMYDFMKEEITFVKKDEVIDAFKFFRKDPNATVEAVLGHFKRQKYFTNSDFSFIDVHNERLFYQNVVVLRKMVQMIENLQLNGEQQTQFLGDLFEGFLDRGIKQSEGQFFTPMPIVKFILMALPLESIIQNNDSIPKAIDYACGAGHFLTELAAQIKPIIEKNKTDINPQEYYSQIYGIEKEYRLSKVAKVSTFMYSQDNIQIRYADALLKHENIQDNSFDILVANPPFAVKGFLETLEEEEQNQFALMQEVSDVIKNNQIQCFFLERAKQLLKVGGIAGIIVPSSVLSNSDTVHIATREMLLEHFDFVALTEFGSRTFGKTGTNTVVLFLRKKDNNPAPHIHYKERVASWFSPYDAEKQAVFQDEHLIHQYCQHIGIKTEDYIPLLQAFDDLAPLQTLLTYDVFKEYQNAFQKTADKLKETHQKQRAKLQKDLKAKLAKENPLPTAEAIAQTIATEENVLKQKQDKELQRELIAYLQTIEKDKLYYFVLASTNPQKVLIVKSPADNAEQKRFLGYEWSGSKGNEGIKYLAGAQVEAIEAEDDDSRVLQNLQAKRIMNTPLFDNNHPQNPTKINYYIQQNFLQQTPALPTELQPFVSYANLIDLLDFTRKDFDKKLSLMPKKNNTVETKWELVKLGDFIKYLPKSRRKAGDGLEQGKFPFFTSSQIQSKWFNENDYKEEALILGTGGQASIHIAKNFSTSADVFTIVTDEIEQTRYLFYFFQSYLQLLEQGFQGVGLKHISKEYLDNLKIPLPPFDVQARIVAECEAIDKETEQAGKAIEEAGKEIEGKINDIIGKYPEKKIAEIAIINPSKSEIKDVDDNTLISFVEMASVSDEGFIAHKVDKPLKDMRKGGYTYFAENDIIIAKITPCMENGKCAIATGLTNGLALGSTEFHVFRPKQEIIGKYLFSFLNRATLRKEAEQNMTGSSGHRRVPASFYESYKIPLPSLAEQARIVNEIEAIEAKINEAKNIIAGQASRKQAVMQRYL